MSCVPNPSAVVPVYLNGPGQPSNLCDCANHCSFCLHKGKAPAGQLCMAHDPWYKTPCDEGRCPGQSDPHCCKKDLAPAACDLDDIDNRFDDDDY